MASEHICGTIKILLELPDGGIVRNTGQPNDPSHNKGNLEIVSEILQQGAAETGWSCSDVEKIGSTETVTLTYIGGA